MTTPKSTRARSTPDAIIGEVVIEAKDLTREQISETLIESLADPKARRKLAEEGTLVVRPSEEGTLIPGSVLALEELNPATGNSIGSDWLASLRNPHTRKAYTLDLRAFLEWCDAVRVHPYEIDRAHIDRWVGELSERDKPSTIARRLGSLRSFYNYVMDAGLIEKNPAARVKRPKVNLRDQNVTPTRTAEELVKVRTVAEKNARDYALVVVLMDTGLRIAEVLSLDIGCIHLDGGMFTLVVKRKGGNLGRVLATHRVVDAVAALEADIAETEGRTSGALFARDGERWKAYQAQTALDRLARHADIEQPLRPHQFRASGITHLLRDGVPLHQVQLWAGHSDPATTQRYNAQREALDQSPAPRLLTLYR